MTTTYSLRQLLIGRLIGLLFAATTLVTGVAQAHDFELRNIHIGHPYARTTLAVQTTGGAYLSLENHGSTDDSLIKVASSIAHSVEMHSMDMQGDIMKMREVDSIALKAGTSVAMNPNGGYHIMLVGLTHPLNAGDKFPMTLTFAKAGKIEVMVHVEADH